MIYHPAQVTEREPDGSWEDCTWCTGVMLWNAINAATVVPPTRHEYEALRVAGGDGPAENPGDGSNYVQLGNGMAARYKFRPTVERGLSFNAAWALLKPGIAMGWGGSMGAVGDALRRWDPAFGKGGKLAGHSVLTIRDDGSDRVWWMNPLAPSNYPGEYVTKAVLRAYYEALNGAGIIYAKVGLKAHTQEPDVIITTTILPFGGKYVIEAGATPTAIKIGSTGAVTDTKKWAPIDKSSSASYDAKVTVSGVTGNPFLRGVDGVFAGWLIPAGSVTETPNPPPAPAPDPQVIADARAHEHELVRAAAIKAAEAL